MKKLYLIIILASIVLLSGCSSKNVNKTICGDKICSLSEDCNTCPQDCSCLSGTYCSKEGICRASVCGDGICTNDKKVSGNCCEDCGCKSNNVCNKITHTCQDTISVNKSLIDSGVENYLKEKNINGKIIKINDTYYGQNPIKVVTLDCSQENSSYPCSIILFIDTEGKIVNQMQTN